MVRPKMFAIKRERARCERNRGEVFHVRAILERIESSDAPFFNLVRHVFVFAAAENIKRAIDKGVTADFGADVDFASDAAVTVILENALLVPLTHVEMLAVEAEIRPGEVRAREQFSESAPLVVAINVAIIIQSFPD